MRLISAGSLVRAQSGPRFHRLLAFPFVIDSKPLLHRQSRPESHTNPKCLTLSVNRKAVSYVSITWLFGGRESFKKAPSAHDVPAELRGGVGIGPTTSGQKIPSVLA